ncbi:hypothetical protein D3C85_1173180 [compost metagenome]
MRQQTTCFGVIFECRRHFASNPILTTEDGNDLLEVLFQCFVKLFAVQREYTLVIHLDPELEDGGKRARVVGRRNDAVAHQVDHAASHRVTGQGATVILALSSHHGIALAQCVGLAHQAVVAIDETLDHALDAIFIGRDVNFVGFFGRISIFV